MVKPDHDERKRIIRGEPKPEDQPIKDQPPEEGGPVRSPKDEPFVRDPALVEADHTTPPVAEDDDK